MRKATSLRSARMTALLQRDRPALIVEVFEGIGDFLTGRGYEMEKMPGSPNACFAKASGDSNLPRSPQRKQGECVFPCLRCGSCVGSDGHFRD